jgi:carbamoyl-phosphate synthase large subunit
MFAKPEYGSGSRGIKVCNEISDIKTLDKEESIHRSSNYLFQEYLPGQEYTVDVLCDLESNPIIVVPRKRLQIKAGISSKGQIIKNKEIENLCKNLCIYLNLKGPVCIQLKEDSKGRFKFIEVNPRLGGGTYFSTLAGVNFLELMLKIKNKQQFKIPKFKEITILRYYNEIVI